MSAINYSKWDHIEISDDEDDTHPNIDTPSLFRWRHQARVEREEEAKKEKESFQSQLQTTQLKKEEMKKKIKELEEKDAAEDLNKMKQELGKIEKQMDDFQKKEEELVKKERLTPWNVDTLCKDGKSKTVINKITTKDDSELTEDERVAKQSTFNKKYKDEIKKYGMFSKYEDTQEYLSNRLYLVCEETANYLVLWCIDLEIEEKHALMAQVAHQAIVLQFILELGKQTDVDPRSCVRPFFSRITTANKEYMTAFNDELNGFKQRIQTRAQQKIDEAMKEHEEEERQKRLGPGGLDPVEVFETLPEAMKACFESKDISLLQKVVVDMNKEDAEYHMKRCIDSGLWVPGAGDTKESVPVQEQGDREPVDEQGSSEDEIYHDVN